MSLSFQTLYEGHPFKAAKWDGQNTADFAEVYGAALVWTTHDKSNMRIERSYEDGSPTGEVFYVGRDQWLVIGPIAYNTDNLAVQPCQAYTDLSYFSTTSSGGSGGTGSTGGSTPASTSTAAPASTVKTGTTAAAAVNIGTTKK